MKKNVRRYLITFLMLCACVCCAFALGCSNRNTVKVSFETNGGDAITSVKVTKNEEYTLPTDITRDGYEFDGWYLEEDLSGSAVTSITPEEDTTVYAKWARLYTITLDLNGGTLSTTTLQLKENAVIYDFMADYTPTAGESGYVFGDWYLNGSALGLNVRMTGDITLTAMYKVSYNIEIYQQSLDLSGYEKGSTLTYYEYPGETVDASVTITGFTAVSNSNEVTSITLSETPSSNILRVYYDREVYTVKFNSNYPDGTSTITTTEVVYGNSIEIPYEYSFTGYVLVGWAETPSGTAVYGSSYIAANLYGGNFDADDAETLSPTRDITLYAKWLAGYTDVFGGTDVIYLLDSGELYMCRGGSVFFKGGYDSSTSEFYFIDDDGSYILEGKLNSNGTYSYRNTTRAESSVAYKYSYSMTSTGSLTGGYDTDVYLKFGEYNDLTYVDAENDNSYGTYVIDDDGVYTVTFTSGYLADQVLTIEIGYVYNSSTGVYTTVFLVRNDTEYNMGLIPIGTAYNYTYDSGEVVTVLTYYYTTYYYLSLDGYGTATYYYYSGSSTYYYIYDSTTNLITLYSSSTPYAYVYLLTISGMTVAMFYEPDYAITVSTSDGGSITMDGLYNLTYTDAEGNVYTSYYYLSSSLTGGVIITFSANGVAYNYMLTSDGTTYTATGLIASYSEYYYYADGYIYYSPMLVIDYDGEGTMRFYAYSSSGYILVSSGTYTYDGDTELYTYTVTQTYEYSATPYLYFEDVDPASITSVTFMLDVSMTSYSINYWLSYTYTYADADTEEKKSETVELYDAYTYTETSDGEEVTVTLYFVNGVLIWNDGDSIYRGFYSYDDTTEVYSLVIVVSSGYTYRYVMLNDDGTFVFVSSSLTLYLYESGSTNTDVTLYYDGITGEWIYTDENGVSYVGTISDDVSTSTYGYTEYTFNSDDGTVSFKFIQSYYTSSSSYVYVFFMYDADKDVQYYGVDGGYIKLDGYEFIAEYVDANDNSSYVYYVVASSYVYIYNSDEGAYYYLDITEDDKYTVRGSEYGIYCIVDNQIISSGFSGEFLSLDGYGSFVYLASDLSTVIYSGTYTISDSKITLSFTVSGTDSIIEGKLGTYTYSSSTYNIFAVSYSQVARSYVNTDDWSLIVLDGVGNAVYYYNDGSYVNGYYAVITDELFYYEDEDGNNAALFRYNAEKGTVTTVSFTSQNYYASDFTSLLFTVYGYVTVGDEEYFYDIDSDGNIILYVPEYYYDSDVFGAAEVNEYGFIKYTFGKSGENTTFNSKQYYYSTGPMSFARATDNADKYPIVLSTTSYTVTTLTFTPSDDEFTVTGTVLLNGTSYSCVVVRELNDNGEYEMYFVVSNYYFYITVNYLGFDEEGNSLSTYEITSMTYILPVYSYYYLYLYYYYFYSSYGYYYVDYLSYYYNYYGLVYIVNEFDESGETVTSALTGYLLTAEDREGNSFIFENVSYSYYSSDGLYYIEFTADDGYTYGMYFFIDSTFYNYLGTYDFVVYALTRIEDVYTDDGYQVKIGRVVYSDYTSMTVGSILTVELLYSDDNGETYTAIEATNAFSIDENFYYVSRITTTDADSGEEVITETTYYLITLTTDDTDDGDVPLYASATVKAITASTYYTADDTTYVDILPAEGEDGEPSVALIVINGTGYLVSSSSYDAATGAYTVTLYNGTVYTLTLSTDEAGETTAVLTEVEEDTEEET